jgi:surface protein
LFKSALQSTSLLDQILEAESHLNTAINDLQMEQSNAIFSQLVDVSKGVAELLDHFGTLAMSQSNPSVTIQQQFDKVLADAQAQAPEVAVSITGDTINHAVREYDSLNHAEAEIVLSQQQQKILFRPSKEDVLAISLNSSSLKFSDDRRNLLGGGGFAEVFRGTYDHRPVAVKRLKAYDGDLASLSQNQISRDVERLAAEAILTHKCGKHSNIIHIVGCLTILNEVERPLIVMELMHTTLFDALHDQNQKDTMGYSRRLYLLKGIAGALEFLHLQGIVHHDIKSLNILLNNQLTVAKLADFGESKVKGLHTTKFRLNTIMATTSHKGNQVAGTAAYQAPEILSEEVSDTSRVCEMFSFGVTVWECLTGSIPHMGKKESSIALLAANKKHLPMLDVPSRPVIDLPEMELASWKALKVIATMCISRDRSIRPTASVVVGLWHRVKTAGKVEPFSFSLENLSTAKTGGIVNTLLPTDFGTQGSASQAQDHEEESKAEYGTFSKKRCYSGLSVYASIVVLLGSIVVLTVTLVPRTSPESPSPLLARLSLQTTEDLYDAVDVYVGATRPITSIAATKYGYPIGSWDVSQITNFTQVFDGLGRNRAIRMFDEDLSSWDVSAATTMQSMFNGADAFNSNLSAWNVSQVTDMSFMFWGASTFNGDLSSWKVDRVENIKSMFGGAGAFNGDLSAWNVSLVTDMSFMFWGASTFDGDLSSWSVDRVTSMESMFEGAGAFKGDLSLWNVRQVTDMSFMFWRASSFNGDLSSWDVEQVTGMQSMFQFAAAFNGDLSNWDVRNVTTMQDMFYGATSFTGTLCSWLEKLPLDCNVDKMFFMAQSCTDRADIILPIGPMCHTCTT